MTPGRGESTAPSCPGCRKIPATSASSYCARLLGERLSQAWKPDRETPSVSHIRRGLAALDLTHAGRQHEFLNALGLIAQVKSDPSRWQDVVDECEAAIARGTFPPRDQKLLDHARAEAAKPLTE